MANVQGIHSSLAARSIDPVGPASASPAASGPAGVTDTVEISTAAKLAAKVRELPAVRAELVERVKTEIAAGNYETPERIEIAVDRLTDELFPG